MPAQYWMLANGAWHRATKGTAELPSAVCLHTHTCYSTENLASLNWVVRLPYMRPLKGVLQRSFGLGSIADLDYGELCYHPPFRPDDIWHMEERNARLLGFDRLLLAITDHDEIAGSVELRRRRRAEADLIGVGEELSIRFDGHLFHLGLTGLPWDRADQVHAGLIAGASSGDLDQLFEELRAVGCLVVLNHPLLEWHTGHGGEAPAEALLRRYGWAIDALEINGMRSPRENEGVVHLAHAVGKPLVAGGDSHLLMPSCALTASRATSYDDFIDEVRAGESRPIVTEGYFVSLRWKLLLRVLSFIAQYRHIAEYRGEPIATILHGRWVTLDPVGQAARVFLAAAGRLGRLA